MSGLHESLVGAWQLESFVVRDESNGGHREPLGSDPRGLITYTADGFVTAQLAKPDMTGYIAYGGRFTVNDAESTVSHQVSMSTMPELLAAPQIRHAALDRDRLVLSVIVTDSAGAPMSSVLVWSRPQLT